VTNAAKYNTAISQAYARWTARFVRTEGSNLKVIAPEQENGVTTSEAMGYGMLIAAAMGDKSSFDKMWGYVQTQMDSGMMKWKPSGTGTATDGDEDIIYALLMAASQWGGTYGASASTWITAFKSKDVVSNMITAGSGNWTSLFNASYFAPSFYRAFGGLDTTISNGYAAIAKSVAASTGSFPTDWADPNTGAPGQAGEVQSGLTNAYGYDAARVPWRVGLDVCGGGSGGAAVLSSIVSFFSGKYDQGATIDLMKAGWLKSTGTAATTAKDMQGSFIGPLGVGGMATGNTVMRDRAFRAILDILENGDFNHTYFPSTVGFITLLTMSGNFPIPS
jgi:endo-1,4-beta-D-glucanase Y